ncbi:hypothetical protein CRG98_022729 [Punica granatum]|uniref:Membrane-associated kinase regulator 2 n=1 Tax=Punica granatum TaxID=22663 RepID=A0A2I0JLW2_PUNGR|nr:hypothetical protein CRG98_022729 [Punica granatum]
MEAFSLLKYWRGGGVVGGCDAFSNARASSTTIVTTAVQAGVDTLGDEGSVDGKGGSSSGEEEDVDEGSDVGDGGEFNFTLSSSCSSASSVSGDGCAGSPSDDLFFKGRLVPIEPGSSSEPNNPNSKPHLPVSLMKSATRLRVFMLGLKKPKADQQKDLPEKSQAGGKPLAVKLKVEEVPIISLFTRDNSSKSQKQAMPAHPEEVANGSDEKILFSKEAVQRYLKKVKPLYVRVSRRYGEKLRFSSGQLGSAGKVQTMTEQPTPAEAGGGAAKGHIRQGNIPAGLRVVCKHLGKSRSASSAVAAAPNSNPSSSRRDDSLLQQQDWIQSAILHCKRSFNASRGIPIT